jgi:hypothetical protein
VGSVSSAGASKKETLSELTLDILVLRALEIDQWLAAQTDGSPASMSEL